MKNQLYIISLHPHIKKVDVTTDEVVWWTVDGVRRSAPRCAFQDINNIDKLVDELSEIANVCQTLFVDQAG